VKHMFFEAEKLISHLQGENSGLEDFKFGKPS
jgi:hypothetical protein